MTPFTLSQRVPSTHMGNTYPNHKGDYYYRNHTLYHIGTLDPLGLATEVMFGIRSLVLFVVEFNRQAKHHSLPARQGFAKGHPHSSIILETMNASKFNLPAR